MESGALKMGGQSLRVGHASTVLTLLVERSAGRRTAAGFTPWDEFPCPATATVTSTPSHVKGMYGGSPLRYPALAWRGVRTRGAKAEVLKRKPISRL